MDNIVNENRWEQVLNDYVFRSKVADWIRLKIQVQLIRNDIPKDLMSFHSLELVWSNYSRSMVYILRSVMATLLVLIPRRVVFPKCYNQYQLTGFSCYFHADILLLSREKRAQNQSAENLVDTKLIFHAKNRAFVVVELYISICCWKKCFPALPTMSDIFPSVG